MKRLTPQPPITPLGALGRGLLAGVAGTAAMTGWQMLAARLRPSDDAPSDPPDDPWEQASAPAKVAKRIGEGVLQREVSPDLIPLLTHGMHWGYGIGWGTVYGLVAGSAGRSGVADGAVFGTLVWIMSYVQLVPMGLYELPWKYEPQETALDLSYHLVYGAGVAAAFHALDAR